MTHPDDPGQRPSHDDPSGDRPAGGQTSGEQTSGGQTSGEQDPRPSLPAWQQPQPPRAERPADTAPAGTHAAQGSEGDPFTPVETPLQPYASYRTVYQQPPPGGNGWKIATIVLSVVLTLGVLGFVGLGVLGYYVVSQELTSTDLQQGVESSCEDLAMAASELQPLAGPDAAGDALTGLADAARGVAEAAEESATDSASDGRFVRDATELADALEGLADDPAQEFEMPTRDGTPVSVLLSSGTPTCLVPPVVTALDPDAGDDLVVSELVPF